MTKWIGAAVLALTLMLGGPTAINPAAAAPLQAAVQKPQPLQPTDLSARRRYRHYFVTAIVRTTGLIITHGLIIIGRIPITRRRHSCSVSDLDRGGSPRPLSHSRISVLMSVTARVEINQAPVGRLFGLLRSKVAGP